MLASSVYITARSQNNIGQSITLNRIDTTIFGGVLVLILLM
ncbi:hypothetical protein PRJ_Dakar_00494 [Faustovirus]|nr:hypothetical protein PRJ_Dakar_00494 [Faustovirus]